MPWGFAAAAVGTVAASAIGADAAGDAADAQTASDNASRAEQRRQFDSIQKLLSPYVQAGSGTSGVFDRATYLATNPDVAADPYYSLHPEEHYDKFGKSEGRGGANYSGGTPGALAGQQDLLGLNGNAAQSSAINGIQNSASFQAQLAQGENSIRQNASATGGLRGGNIQAALAQFSPALLNQNIQQQYSNLAGLTSLGQSSAAGLGTAGQNNANAISQLNSQTGAAQAGNALAQGTALSNGINGLTSAFTGYLGSRSPAVADGGYSMGLGSAYGGSRQGL